MNFALYDLRLAQQRCQMLLDEVCGDASRFLHPGFVPENTERSSLAFTGIQPVVGFEAVNLAEEVHKGIPNPPINLLAVVRIEPISSDHCVHSELPSYCKSFAGSKSLRLTQGETPASWPASKCPRRCSYVRGI